MQNDVFLKNDVSCTCRLVRAGSPSKLSRASRHLTLHNARIAHGHCGHGCGAEVRAGVGPPVSRSRCGNCSPSGWCCCCRCPGSKALALDKGVFVKPPRAGEPRHAASRCNEGVWQGQEECTRQVAVQPLGMQGKNPRNRKERAEY